MSSGKNKESLMVFLVLSSLPCMYITSRSKCILLTPGVSPNDPIVAQEIPELTSDREEADTRVLLHSKHAAGSHERIIIKTPDTDVFVLCTTKQKAIAKDMFLMTGTGNRFRLIDVSAVSDGLGEDLCRLFPGFHAFTASY